MQDGSWGLWMAFSIFPFNSSTVIKKKKLVNSETNCKRYNIS